MGFDIKNMKNLTEEQASVLNAMNKKCDNFKPDIEKVIKRFAVRIASDSEEFDTVEIPTYEAKEILELLKEQQQYEWTSVEERMPDKEGFYLVSAKRGNFHPWVAEMKMFMGIKGFCNGAAMPVVGAWMPLPKPYGLQNATKDGEHDG